MNEKIMNMKTLFTLILLYVVSVSSFAQKSPSEVPTTQSLSSASVSKVPAFSLLKMYPNPVKNMLTVEIQSFASGSVQIGLINILGTEVKTWNAFTLSKGDQSLRLDFSEFKSGVYFLKISKSGQVVTQIVKKN